MSTNVSESEWQVMRVLWTESGLPSTEIYERLRANFPWKLSTIKTLVNRLMKKGYLNYVKKSNKYLYYPKIEEKDLVQKEVSENLDNICNTKYGKLIIELLKNLEINKSDLLELEDIIKDKLAEAPEEVECRCNPGQCDCMPKAF